MKELNHNNFLRWKGSFKQAPFDNIAANDAFSYNAGNPSAITVDVLANDTSTYGVDPLSFEFVEQVNDDIPATWNSFTKKVTFYPLAAQTPGSYLFRYRWKDVLGNTSNIATVNVTVLAEAEQWVPVEFFCLVDSNGDHTGQQMVSYFQLYEGNPSVPVEPAVYKPNIISDPDYMPPYDSPFDCPVGSLPVSVAFMVSISTPGEVDPSFRLASFEIRRMFDNGLVKSGTLDQIANSTTATQCAAGVFKLILNFTNFDIDAVPKEVYVQSSLDVAPYYVEYPVQPVDSIVTIENITSFDWINAVVRRPE